MQSSSLSFKTDQQGGNIVVTIILAVALVASLGFGFWAYAGMADYKNNVDKKIAAANDIVKQQTATAKDNEYNEKAKSPYTTYNGPNTYGAVSFKYPKTWSAYIVTATTNQGDPVAVYLNPNFVPSTDSGTTYALRFRVVAQSYNDELASLTGSSGSDASASPGLQISPYRAKNVPSVLGSRLIGAISDSATSDNATKINMVVLPIRDKTLEIWTESDQYIADFNNIVLPSLTFSP